MTSVEKRRKIQRKSKSITQAEYNIDPLKNAGVELFELNKVARSSSQLYNLIADLEIMIEEAEFRAPLMLENKTINGK